MSLILKVSSLTHLFCKWFGFTSVATLTFYITARPLQALEVERDSFCQLYPADFHCTSNFRLAQGDRSPTKINSASQTIRVRLNVSGPNNEWIRMDVQDAADGMRLSAYHTKQIRQEVLSGVANGLLEFGAEQLAQEVTDDGYDGPVPLPNVISFYRWADHKTQRIVFFPDSCAKDSVLRNTQSYEQSSCAIAGTKTITLPQGTDLRKGRFMLEYLEEDLVRIITFRLPPQES